MIPECYGRRNEFSPLFFIKSDFCNLIGLILELDSLLSIEGKNIGTDKGSVSVIYYDYTMQSSYRLDGIGTAEADYALIELHYTRVSTDSVWQDTPD